MGVNSPAISHHIGAARDTEERMLKWSDGMEPRFISWNVAAVDMLDFTFPDAWSRKKMNAPPSRRTEIPADVCNDVYTTADDLSLLK